MRNVLRSSNEVYHYFANKVQPSGRAGNTSFAYPNAYSYAAIIGKHFNDGVAISNNTWSVTTSSHQSDLRQACRHLTCIYVPDPSDVNTSYRAVKINVDKILKKASTARLNRDYYLGDALRQIEQFNILAKWCKSDLYIEAPVTDPEALKAIAQAVRQENAKKIAARRERIALENMDLAERCEAWRNGKNPYIPRYDVPVMLRISGDQIETSKGAYIPLNQAETIWRLIGRAMQGQRDYEIGQAVGVYQLTRIRRDGSIVVGCHDIPFTEILGIAVQLGYAL